MTVAIISVKTRKVQKDANGDAHIYSDSLFAEKVCDKMNRKAFELDGGDPIHPAPVLFRVVPW